MNTYDLAVSIAESLRVEGFFNKNSESFEFSAIIQTIENELDIYYQDESEEE